MAHSEGGIGGVHAETVAAIRRINVLTGFWYGRETIHPSESFPDGAEVDTSHRAQLDLAGHCIVAHEYRRQGDAIVDQALKMFGWDATCGRYTCHVFGTGQPNPPRPAFGTWRDNTLTLEQSTDDGRIVLVYTFEDEFHYVFRMLTSRYGEELMPVVEGRYERHGQ
jgi:hypothetical protein